MMPISNPIFSILGYARLASHGLSNTNLSYTGPQIIICLKKKKNKTLSAQFNLSLS